MLLKGGGESGAAYTIRTVQYLIKNHINSSSILLSSHTKDFFFDIFVSGTNNWFSYFVDNEVSLILGISKKKGRIWYLTGEHNIKIGSWYWIGNMIFFMQQPRPLYNYTATVIYIK